MKKFLSLLFILSLSLGQIFAVWSDDYVKSRILDSIDSPNAEYSGFHPFVTSNGNVVHTWLRSDLVPYKDTFVHAYTLRMQVFDENGNITLGEHGVTISEQPTRSYYGEYGVDVLPCGDVVALYADARHYVGKEDKYNRMYLYRYNQKGESVWDPEGIVFPADTAVDGVTSKIHIDHAMGALCVNDTTIYVGVYVEKFINSEWVPTEWQIIAYDTTGHPRTEKPLIIKTIALKMYRAPQGEVYIIHSDATGLVYAQRFDANLQDVWGRKIIVENTNISAGGYFVLPRIQYDEEGLAFAYRKLRNLTGYIVMNHLTPDAEVIKPAKLVTVTDDGADAGVHMLAVNGNRILIAWIHKPANQEFYLAYNIFDTQGNVLMDSTYGNEMFPGEPTRGHFLDHKKYEWNASDYNILKVIPREDGWIVLYCSNNDPTYAKYTQGVDFGRTQVWVVKLDLNGKIVARREVGRSPLNMSATVESGARTTAVVYDDTYAYIFYRQTQLLKDNVQDDSQMRVFCIDITNTESWTATDKPREGFFFPTDVPLIRTNDVNVVNGLYKIYSIEGKILSTPKNGIVTIIHSVDQEGKPIIKKILKSN